MRLRSGGVWAALVGLALIVVSCTTDDGTASLPADGGIDGASSQDGASSDDASIDGAMIAEADVRDASADVVVDATIDADAEAGTVYAGNYLWSNLYGEPDALEMGGATIVPGPMESVYLSSAFSGTVSFGIGGTVTGPSNNPVNPDTPNCFLARIDKDGQHVWIKSFVSDAQSSVVGCQVFGADASGVYVFGSFNGTRDVGGGAFTAGPFLAKYDHTGAHVWSRKIPNAAARSAALVGGDIVLFDRFSGAPDYGGGALTGTGARSFLARFTSASGTYVWSKQSVGSMLPHAIKGDTAGNIVIGGGLTGSIDWGAGPVTSAGIYDVFIAKFDGAGNLMWTKRAGGANNDQARALALDPADNIYVTGEAQGTFDIGTGPITPTNPTVNFRETVFLAKLSSAGVAQWSKVWSTNGPEVWAIGWGVATDPAGNVIVTGHSECGLDFGNGLLPAKDGVANWFAAKLTSAGAHLWSRGWAGVAGAGARGRSVAADTNGNTLLLGDLHESTINMGGGSLTAQSDRHDPVLAKFTP